MLCDIEKPWVGDWITAAQFFCNKSIVLMGSACNSAKPDFSNLAKKKIFDLH